MDELTVLIDAAGWEKNAPALPGAPSAAIVVRWEPAAAVMPARAAAYLDERWRAHLAEAQAAGKSLFNGAISRLIRAARINDKIELCLGPGDYKGFLVTCLRDRAWFQAHAPDLIVRALGSSALLTRGERAFLGIRSAQVSAYAGRAHLLGGVVECLGVGVFPADASGLLAHLRLELFEEAGLTPDDLCTQGPRLLGIVQDNHFGQPEAIWQWELNTALSTVGPRLNAQEHGGWLELDRGGIDGAAWELMTPVARHAWRIWSRH